MLGAYPEELVSLFEDEFEEKVSRSAAEGGGMLHVIKVKKEVESEAKVCTRTNLTYKRGYSCTDEP